MKLVRRSNATDDGLVVTASQAIVRLITEIDKRHPHLPSRLFADIVMEFSLHRRRRDLEDPNLGFSIDELVAETESEAIQSSF